MGYLSIQDTFARSRLCPQQRGSTVYPLMKFQDLSNVEKLLFSWFLSLILLIFSLFWTFQDPSKPICCLFALHRAQPTCRSKYVLYTLLELDFKAICQSKYVLNTLLELDFKVSHHLVRFQGFSGVKCEKTAIFMAFEPHFAYFQPIYDLLGACKVHMSEKIYLIYINRVRCQGYIQFKEVSGLQWRQIRKNSNFYGF